MTSHEYKEDMIFSPDDFAHLKIPLRNILSATNNFSDRYICGEDAYEKYYRGQLLWSGELINIYAGRLNKERFDADQQFWMEVSILSTLKHKNLVSFVGFCDENDEKIIIIRRETKGSLISYLNYPTSVGTPVKPIEFDHFLVHHSEVCDGSRSTVIHVGIKA